MKKEIFKLKKLFKEEQQIKSSSSLKEPIVKANCFNLSKRTANSLSNGISFNGGTIKGGKVFNGSTATQKVIVIAKNYNSGYDNKTKTKTTNKEAGTTAASHLDYINKEERNEERSMIIEQFDNVLENEIYLYSKEEFHNINIEDLEAKIEKDLKYGKIESSLSFEADDKILDDKKLLKDISKNNKLYVENEASTGKVKIHLKGNNESLELAINKLNKTKDEKLKVEDIKEIKTNIYDKHGEQLSYKDFNKKKKDLKEKGIRGASTFIVSPNDKLTTEEFKAVIENTIKKMEEAIDKKLDWNFTIHTNTKHPHAHIDVLSDKGAIKFSKPQLQAFKTLISESILEVEIYSKRMEEQKSLIDENKNINKIQDVIEDNQEFKMEKSNTKIFNNEDKYLEIAKNENSSAEALDKLVEKVEYKNVLKAVIEHDNTSEQTLAKLIDHKIDEIADKAFDKLKERVLKLEKYIANNENSTSEELDKVIKYCLENKHDNIIKDCINNDNISDKALGELVYCSNKEISEKALNKIEIREELKQARQEWENSLYENYEERKQHTETKQEEKQHHKRSHGYSM